MKEIELEISSNVVIAKDEHGVRVPGQLFADDDGFVKFRPVDVPPAAEQKP